MAMLATSSSSNPAYAAYQQLLPSPPPSLQHHSMTNNVFIAKKPCHHQNQRPTTILNNYFEVIPSDQAYLDVILDYQFANGEKRKEIRWEDFVEVETKIRRHCQQKKKNRKKKGGTCSSGYICSPVTGGVEVLITHYVKYRQETVWKFSTKCTYDVVKGKSGQSSTCSIMKSKGILRVKILHKNKTSLGGGSNFTETRNYSIFALIARSGQARQRDLEGYYS